MKKKVRWICAGFLILAAVTGCSSKADEVDTIQGRGELRVAIPSQGSVHMTMESGNPAGLEIEIAEDIAAALGTNVTYVQTDKSALLAALDGQEADMAIGGISAGTGMEDRYLFSQSYEKGWLYAVVLEGFYGDTLGTMNGEILGVPASMSESVKNGLAGSLEESVFREYDDANAVEEALKDGSIRAYICARSEAGELLNISGLQVQNIRDMDPEEYVMAVPAGSVRLLSGINVILENRAAEASE